jgi:hypothetical protein
LGFCEVVAASSFNDVSIYLVMSGETIILSVAFLDMVMPEFQVSVSKARAIVVLAEDGNADQVSYLSA